LDTLTGSVERVTFYNPENGYSVLRLKPDSARTPGVNREGFVTVIGNLPELTSGEHLKLSGKWVNHSKYGMQFQVEVCEQNLPATVNGIRRYLGSGLVAGIGPRLAEKIVEHFGVRTLEVIENQPNLLREVRDIGAKRSHRIARAWEEQKQIKEIMLFLHSYGVSTNLAVKIFKQYGQTAMGVVQNDPYRLARDIHGVGFRTADKIARSLGLPMDHPSRLEAGVVFVLNESTNEGHVYFPRAGLADRAVKLLEVDLELVQPAIERLAVDDRVRLEMVPFPGSNAPDLAPPPARESSQVFESEASFGNLRRTGEAGALYGQPGVYLTPLYHNETGVASRLRQIAGAWPSRLSDLPPVFIPLDPSLSPEQAAAIRTALSHPLSVLTGGPGTGKTTALKALIAALEGAKKSYALASPTGRAAKRLSQATGRPASTIHRLLLFKPGEGFRHNAENPLPVDLVVVDEASMLDLSVANSLLKAIQPGTHLLLVGDVDQLPSVGAGDVLRDLIDSELAPVTRLSVIFRQAAHSHIITNAHRINAGQTPLFPNPAEINSPLDFFFFPAETPEEAGEWVQDVVCNRIPKKFGFHPRDEIQVLAPMYRGPVGVNALNIRLQTALNPPAPLKAEKSLFGQILRVGDKLMQTQNNYEKEVYNGDIGYLFEINPVEHSMTVDFEGRAVIYDWSEADQLVLAYAVSVHKAQGSEFPAVVIPLATQHYLMLQRNLFYTAVTRAKKLCVLVGSRKAMGMAVRNNQVAQRFTALDWRLKSS